MLVPFALEHSFHTGTFQPEIKTADAAEQRQNFHTLSHLASDQPFTVPSFSMNTQNGASGSQLQPVKWRGL